MAPQPNEEAIFQIARKIGSPTDRGIYLEQVCGDDAALRERVQALLSVSEGDEAFMRQPVALLGTGEYAPVNNRIGTAIGPYKLLEQIGEGGFGVVFMAEQTQPVRRRVALKVLKPGMDTRQVVARFEAERQALALMEHPNIARVFDGGETASGRPYFVMELVRGVPLIEFCDANRMPVRQRLELFITVCQAVQHAHHKGIIHRDLKPANIMVTLHDGVPVVKVIDFGIAKALGQQLTDKTLFTNFALMIGTPVYMSPEQAEMSGLDIDTRSDIYSLGVLLYELLTGTTPCDRERMKTAAFDEIRRMIREEEPATPSICISTLGTAATIVSSNRKCEPGQLRQLVRGELDWIVMKAVEKDRNRRYETASAFVADLLRYLADEPVLACPPSAIYRFRKFARRHKAMVAMSGLIGCVLILLFVLGIGVLVNNATRAERDQAQANQRRAENAEQRALEAEREIKIRSHLARAVAFRRSGTVGQRYRTLAEIADALKLNPSAELRQELSTEAIAALVLPDLEVAHEWEGWPDDAIGVSFDAEFQRYARVNNQGAITVCRRSEGREEVVHRLPAHGKPPFAAPLMSLDGRFVVHKHSGTRAEGQSFETRVWKLDGPTPLVVLDEPTTTLENAWAFHSNVQQLAIGHLDKTVSVYDLETGRRIHRLTVSSSPSNLEYHPRDGRLAVTCDNLVHLFDTDSGREMPPLRHGDSMHAMAWHPDGRRLATGGYDRKIHVWDTETATEVMAPWTGHTHDGLRLKYNHAGDRIWSYDWGTGQRLWDAVTGRILLNMPRSFGVQFSRDDRLFGFAVSGNKIQLHRFASGRELRVLRRRNADSLENITNPVVSADGRTLAACDPNRLSFFSLDSGEELGSIQQPSEYAASPVYFQRPHSDGDGARSGWVTGGYGGMLLWPARTDAARPDVLCIGPPESLGPGLGTAYARGASASGNGRVVAVPFRSSTVVVHRDRPDSRLRLGPMHDVRYCAVSHDGRWVVTCSWWWDGRSNGARIWDSETGKPVHELPLLESEVTAKFSPDGRWLATLSTGGGRLWEVGTWREVRRLGAVPFAFSPDGKMLAIGDISNVIRLQETETGREVARLTGPEPIRYRPTCFTSDQTRLIAMGFHETALYVWDLRLIRQQLKELDLDWDWDEFPPAEPTMQVGAPSQLEVVLGEWGGEKLSPEEKARRAIDQYRTAVAAKPDDPLACNNLAWAYLTAPETLRDVTAAVPLAEKAVQLDARPLYRNTLGLAYYRTGRYREAVDTLRANLLRQDDQGLAFDLYFLAMSYHQLGETTRARDYFDWAVRWIAAQPSLPAGYVEELNLFRSEAEELLHPTPDKS